MIDFFFCKYLLNVFKYFKHIRHGLDNNKIHNIKIETINYNFKVIQIQGIKYSLGSIILVLNIFI